METTINHKKLSVKSAAARTDEDMHAEEAGTVIKLS